MARYGQNRNTGQRVDPYGTYNFRVEIEGLTAGGFSEVSGLTAETEVERRREGGLNDFEYTFPKGTKYPDLVLKRGMSDSELLYDWYREVSRGKIKKKSITVSLRDPAGRNALASWVFYHAFPIKWEGPALNATGNAVATEKITLAHEGFELQGLHGKTSA